MHNLSPQLRLLLIVPCVAVAVAMRAQAPAMPTGKVIVAKVEGQATATAQGVTKALARELSISAPATVTTGPRSSTVLVFSNGVTLQLGADTELVLQEFLQEPFTRAINVSELNPEPSVSHTKFVLNQGEIIGQLQTLAVDRGSSYSVQTPVGVARMRGGVFRMALRPTETGQRKFALTAASGDIAFEPAIKDPTAKTTKVMVVRPGQEIDLMVPATDQGRVDWNAVVPTSAAPATLMRIMMSAAQTRGSLYHTPEAVTEKAKREK
jgi:hypothetical protein